LYLKTADADVYEVGHHGSYNGTTKALLDAITPKIALIGMGSPDRQETFSAWRGLLGSRRAMVDGRVVPLAAAQFDARITLGRYTR
jgi:hypothetical protein